MEEPKLISTQRIGGMWMILGVLVMVFTSLCGGRLSAQEPFVTQTDMVKWFDSTLPADTYVGVHAENWDDDTQTWKAATGVYQPFKSIDVPALHQIYWRKDDTNLNDDFYGELFTYDEDNIYLHSETFPTWPAPLFDPTWDIRYDRFRLFVNRATAYENGIGRIIAPRMITQAWRISQHFDTYLVDSMEENNTKTGYLWQNNFYDNDVFITIERPFSTVYDGECAGWPADEDFKTFDEAVIVNQQMENNAGRERFIFARKGDTFYGIVRWDGSQMVNGQWKVTGRTIGLKQVKASADLSFAGFTRRSREDIFIAPFTGERNAVQRMDGYK